MNDELNDFGKYILKIYLLLLKSQLNLSLLLRPPPYHKFLQEQEQFNRFPFYQYIEKINVEPEKIEILIDKVQDLLAFICDQEIHQSKQLHFQIPEVFPLQFDFDFITHSDVMYLPIMNFEKDMLISDPKFCDQSCYFEKQYKEQIPPAEVIQKINITKFEVVLIFWRIKLLLEEQLKQNVTINLYPAQHNFSITIKNGDLNILYFINEKHKQQFLTQNFITRKEVFNFRIDKLFQDHKIQKLEMLLFKLQASDEILSKKNSYNLRVKNKFIDYFQLFQKSYEIDDSNFDCKVSNESIIEELNYPYNFSTQCNFKEDQDIFDHRIILYEKQLPKCQQCGKIIEEHNYNKLFADPLLIMIFENFQQISKLNSGFEEDAYRNPLYLNILTKSDQQIALLYYQTSKERKVVSSFIVNSKNENFDLAFQDQFQEDHNTYFSFDFDELDSEIKPQIQEIKQQTIQEKPYFINQELESSFQQQKSLEIYENNQNNLQTNQEENSANTRLDHEEYVHSVESIKNSPYHTNDHLRRGLEIMNSEKNQPSNSECSDKINEQKDQLDQQQQEGNQNSIQYENFIVGFEEIKNHHDNQQFMIHTLEQQQKSDNFLDY